MRELYQTLNQRRRPEDVAHMILEVCDGFSDAERAIIDKAAKGSLKNKLLKVFLGGTSMPQEFSQPIGLERQVKKARELFSAAREMTAAECSDPAVVEKFIRELGMEIKKAFGGSDFKADRLNRERRDEAGLDISKRRYNKLFRHLIRMEAKLEKLMRELRKLQFTMIGKSLFASQLTWDEFSKDVNSSSFIAYFTARCNLRSQFTNSSQEKAYDEISDMLLKRCKPATMNYWAIAHVYPETSILDHLNEEQRGVLLGRWNEVLRDVAALLKEVWESSEIDRQRMIVRRGNDSTTWNNTASAWNKARSSWIALLYALGMEELLDAYCPGKVLRLMAADVAHWHLAKGGGLEPDTRVWAEIPLPWDVLGGNVTCTRRQIENLCAQYGVDPFKKGWTAPRTQGVVAEFKPTPELVHGVEVSSPQLAIVLRKAGWFSGGGVKHAVNTESIAIRRDEHGAVLGVDVINDQRGTRDIDNTKN